MTFDEAVVFFKSQNKLADALGCTAALVSQWKRAGEIPELWQWKIQGLTDNTLTVDERFIKIVAA